MQYGRIEIRIDGGRIERMLAYNVVSPRAEPIEQPIEAPLHRLRLVALMISKHEETALRRVVDTNRFDRHIRQLGSFRRIDDDIVPALAQTGRQITEKDVIAVRLSFSKRRDQRRDDADAQRPLHSSKNSRRHASLAS